MEEDLTALSTKKNGLASLQILAHSYTYLLYHRLLVSISGAKESFHYIES